MLEQRARGEAAICRDPPIPPEQMPWLLRRLNVSCQVHVLAQRANQPQPQISAVCVSTYASTNTCHAICHENSKPLPSDLNSIT